MSPRRRSLHVAVTIAEELLVLVLVLGVVVVVVVIGSVNASAIDDNDDNDQDHRSDVSGRDESSVVV